MKTFAQIFHWLLRLQIVNAKQSPLWLVGIVLVLLCQPLVSTVSCGGAPVTEVQTQQNAIMLSEYHAIETPRFVCVSVQHRSDHAMVFNQLFERALLPILLVAVTLILVQWLICTPVNLPIQPNQPPPTPPPMIV